MSFCYVLLLGALVSATKQYYDDVSSLHEIHAITRSVVDPHLTQPFADRLNITWIPQAEPPDPHFDSGFSLRITQPSQPSVESIALNYFDHMYTIVDTEQMSTVVDGKLYYFSVLISYYEVSHPAR